jgi:hypothetical protein
LFFTLSSALGEQFKKINNITLVAAYKNFVVFLFMIIKLIVYSLLNIPYIVKRSWYSCKSPF